MTMKFDLTPVEEEVLISDIAYTLREASGETAGKYQEKLIQFMKPNVEGKPTTLGGGISSIEPLLVHWCLFDADNKNVKIDVIKKWPARIQKELFKKAKEMSGLDAEETIEELEEKLKEAREKADEGDEVKNE